MPAKYRNTKTLPEHQRTSKKPTFSPPARVPTVVLPPAHLLNIFDVVIPSTSDLKTSGITMPPAHLLSNFDIVIPVATEQGDGLTGSSSATDDSGGSWKDSKSTKGVHRTHHFPEEATVMTPDRPVRGTWAEYVQAHQLDMEAAQAYNMVAGEDRSAELAEMNHLMDNSAGRSAIEYLQADQLESAARIFKLTDEEKELESHVNMV